MSKSVSTSKHADEQIAASLELFVLLRLTLAIAFFLEALSIQSIILSLSLNASTIPTMIRSPLTFESPGN